MNSKCKEFVDYIVYHAPQHNKQVVEDDVSAHFNLTKDRKVYHNEYFAVRFNYSKSSSDLFSNTVLSLSALEKYDKIPFFVVLVRQSSTNLILLANTTFLKKISHSSQELSMTNIRGSFNGSDIMRYYGSWSNSPENFDFLFALHQGLDWKDNLLRLVDASSNIRPVNQKFIPSNVEVINIYNSISRSIEFILSDNFSILEDDLNERCNKSRKEILIASHIENTNIRGRLIESFITSNDEEKQNLIHNLCNLESALPSYDTKNGLGDYYREFNNGDTYTDIKTKVIYLNSNPKAYNIDRFLKQMADSRSIFLFFFIGVDENSIFKTLLCSVYHRKLIDNAIPQFHWAGRNTRGAVQFNGAAIDEMLKDENFTNDICVEKAKSFLKELLDR
ncbi:MAG: hypothetical protein KBT04_04590 [Bacteroidales bacterium]|nr:hypothetical protein [Candidatus Colimorpha onthohippi]